MADIVERQILVTLAHPRHRRGDIERGPIRHRGLEAGQRFRLVVTDRRFLPAIADAAVIIGQDRAAPPRQIARKASVDLAGHGGRRIDQDGMALGPARQKQRRAQQISIGGGEGDVIDEYVVQRSLCHRDFPRSFRVAPANANSAFAARACRG
jgi:hypothetical protein